MRTDSELNGKGIVYLCSGPAVLVEAGQIETVVAATVRDHKDDIERPGSSSAGMEKEQIETDSKENKNNSRGFFLHVYHLD